MKITKNVIEDLMPMYLANELSNDTKALVEEFLNNNPDFAKDYKNLSITLPENIKIPLNKEDQLEAFVKVKRLQTIRTISLAIIISVGILGLLSFIGLLFYLM